METGKISTFAGKIVEMEIKKSQGADLEQKRTQSFLLGMIVVLASLFVLLEWNSGGSGWTLFDDDDSLEAEVELSPLKRDKDEVPMMMPQGRRWKNRSRSSCIWWKTMWSCHQSRFCNRKQRKKNLH